VTAGLDRGNPVENLLGALGGSNAPVDGGTLVTSYYDWSRVGDDIKERFPIVPESALRATLGILERTVRSTSLARIVRRAAAGEVTLPRQHCGYVLDELARVERRVDANALRPPVARPPSPSATEKRSRRSASRPGRRLVTTTSAASRQPELKMPRSSDSPRRPAPRMATRLTSSLL